MVNFKNRFKSDAGRELLRAELPFRAALFSTEQMKQHGRTLAASHDIDEAVVSKGQLLKRLDENEAVLTEVYHLLTAAVQKKRRIAPAGEWLLDNFYLIEEQVATAQQHLPKTYSRELPRLAAGPSAGLPRAYDIALETVSHSDGRLDMEALSAFVDAYQTVTILKLGELWAIPTMLRLALIENLRRVGATMVIGTIDRIQADYWADRLTEVAEKKPARVISVVGDMVRSIPAMSNSFVAEFARRLQGKGSSLGLPVRWMEHQLSQSGLIMADIVQSEIQQQAADQVSISNSIISLRLLGKVDWRDFVEATSIVEKTLRQDPAQAYSKMDFATRDHYRHIVEDLAKHDKIPEENVAAAAIESAAAAPTDGDDARTQHVGYYLIHRKRCCPPFSFYIGTIAFLTIGITAFLLRENGTAGMPIGLLVFLGLLTAFSASQLAVSMMHWVGTVTIPPDQLPRMDFSEGIPQESRTLVVVPAMLINPHHIDRLIEALEVRFLANRDKNLYFGLLTDFQDAPKQDMPDDEALVHLVQAKIRNLNNSYGGQQNGPFFVFHRPRRWNSHQGAWMGYERKRGKLADLNGILRGNSTDQFSLIVGPLDVLQEVRYVITLDTDTDLPRGTARQMVGAMAHPLNRPKYNEAEGRVTQGYGILQPRIDVNLPSANRSKYARMSGSEPGIDPYTRTVSDVYQDFFREGSFIGKGIYDVDVFERALKNRLPDDLILSHDLIEGCHVRSGLLTDVALSEGFPSEYLADVKRRHRWIRGDWQIAQWILPRVPAYDGKSHPNPLSALSRWKIFDNLRRSLVPFSLLLLLTLGWTVLSRPGVWTFGVLAIVFTPAVFASILDFLRKPDDIGFSQHLTASCGFAARRLQQSAFVFACLPHEAQFSLDAIVRTMMRVLVTRKKLLEWNSSDNSDQGTGSGIVSTLRHMWVGPAAVCGIVAWLTLGHPGPMAPLFAAMPILGLWFVSPVVAWWLSRPNTREDPALTPQQLAFLHDLSRKTWKFFETFVGPQDHWLPPDNFQEGPGPMLAHRTSPTNMGIALLANLAAYDFGYISLDHLIERTTNALDTMEKLERHAGHFYNWYDTETLLPLHPLYISTVDSGNLAGFLLTLRQGLLTLPDNPRPDVLPALARRIGLLTEMDFDFLLDKASHLLAIGYNVTERRADVGCYDLLASESRLTSFVEIAQGRVPDENWFALGRKVTCTGGDPVLLSWSGSMFEYLMPLLVMPTYENTLLDETCKAAVKRQIAYCKNRRVPWGISESGYNTVDAQLNYQYRAFGVPGLGFKRGLAGDLVIAPYASALALMISPKEACTNLQRIAAAGFEGTYGMYEAIDYTPSRLPPGESFSVVRSYMVHHQGMSFLSLASLLLDRPMQKRFESEISFQAAALLLYERVPKASVEYLHTREPSAPQPLDSDFEERPFRTFNTAATPSPEVQLLSNGSYHVMVTNAGGGYSRWKDIGVTRWHEDSSCDNWGTFCYIRDVMSGVAWSTAHQPTLRTADHYEAMFSEGRIEFRRRDNGIETRTEIAVSPEDDIELRRVHITNSSRRTRVIDVTSYAEVILAPPLADASHPAFSNLFVQTEIIPERRTILCTRRPRSAGERVPWMFHLVVVHGTTIGEATFETDRARFIGRGRTAADPAAHTTALSGTDGSVLDPIVAIRHRITLHADETATLNIVSGVTEHRESCMRLAQKYEDLRFGDRVFDLAWTHSQAVLRQINSTQTEAQLYGRLASAVIYCNSSRRADPAVLIKNRRPQSGLWAYSISGDLPIVLLRVSDPGKLDLVRQFIQAHAYWRMKGLAVDLVIWNEDLTGYRQLLHDGIIGMITSGIGAHSIDRPGGILVKFAEQLSSEDRILLQTVARVIICDTDGPLAEQLDRPAKPDLVIPKLRQTRNRNRDVTNTKIRPRGDLLFFNGHGGFTSDGREYIITSSVDQMPPAPWVNVMANSEFGTVVSDSGMANTWFENAHEYRITPWKNDPVSDSSGEAFYIRDEETGYFWSPTLLPKSGVTPYVTRHGIGYSIFEHAEDGICSSLSTYVAVDAPIKFWVIKIRNTSGRSRKLSITGYIEWVLADLRARSAMHVTTEVDSSGAIFARNPYNADFSDRVSFFDVSEYRRTISGDRLEFLGRNGTMANPAAMARARLSGRVGSALDPCGAIQVSLDVADGRDREIVFTLGGSHSADAARDLVLRFRGPEAARTALEAVWDYWNHTLGALHVETPDDAINTLTNGWLVYQSLACRFWARSGYYQSGGAFGFRDQLQDAMAFIHAEPRLLREHLLLCAEHQFREGDVQHWWHPPSGRGVRTRCSDDYLWLVVATCRYVKSTGDTGVLDEKIRFIEGRPVKMEEESYYDLPEQSDVVSTLYNHCTQAIFRSLQFGENGLPLMGSGDWNDGMNLVGIHGSGESVWLGLFLHDVLMKFSEIALMRDDGLVANRCRSEAAQLRQNIEKNGWDGDWYRRAYFDDGKPLGSSSNEECQIDSIAQSWSVLSGVGSPERTRSAMSSLHQRLVRYDKSIVQLLDPPFDKAPMDPGYIKGYVPGVRENGGQYTQAAVWAAMAFAELGDHERAWGLWSLINPIHHGNSPESIAIYKVEPYVMAADVYAVSPHDGRGGWTWYTGSAAWTYRLITESLLGMRLEVDKLYFAPCLPADWNTFKVDYRYHETMYHIEVVRPEAGESQAAQITVDGIVQPHPYLHMINDRNRHVVRVSVGDRPSDQAVVPASSQELHDQSY